MLNFNSIKSKRKDKEKYNQSRYIFFNYVLKSSLFWIILSLFFFFYFYNSTIVESSNFNLTTSWQLLLKAFFVILGSIIFSCFIGIFLSIPSIFIKFILNFKLSRRRQRGQKPVILIFITKYTPNFILILINLLFLLFNFSSAPDLLASIFHKKNFLVHISEKINRHILKGNVQPDFYNIGKTIGKKNPNSQFIFFLPENIINDKNELIFTKILLKYSSKIIYTNNYKLDLISSLLHIYPEGYYQLFSNLPVSNSNIIENSNLYIGSDISNSMNFYSLFPIVKKIENLNFTWFEVFLNKFAFTQPQYIYFFKNGFLGHFHPIFSWYNIYKSNENLLEKYSKNIINSGISNFQKYVLFLSGNDTSNKNEIFHQFTKINSETNLKSNDHLLALFIGGLISNGVNNISIIPYQDNLNEITIHNFYSSIPLSKNVYLSENVFEDNNNSSNKCYLKIMDLKNKTFDFNLIKNLNQNSDPILLKEMFAFYIKSKIEKSFICYTNDSSIYYIHRISNVFNPSNLNFGENFSNIFESYSEKQNRGNQNGKLKISPNKSQEIFRDEFFNQFKIYKIDNNTFQINTLQNKIEKEQFLKLNGDDIINQILNYTTG